MPKASVSGKAEELALEPLGLNAGKGRLAALFPSLSYRRPLPFIPHRSRPTAHCLADFSSASSPVASNRFSFLCLLGVSVGARERSELIYCGPSVPLLPAKKASFINFAQWEKKRLLETEAARQNPNERNHELHLQHELRHP